MTRYTKLDKRRALNKATDLTVGAAYDADGDDDGKGPQASTSTLPPPLTNSNEPPSTNSPIVDDTASAARLLLSDLEPKKLQSRLKLLRLKLKNAKTAEKKQELTQQVQSVNQALKEANGHRGGAGETAGGEKKRRRDGDVSNTPAISTGETNPWKAMEAARREKSAAKSAQRRDKRQAERAATTRCFACRGMGHAAKDCPQSLNANSTALDAEAEKQWQDKSTSSAPSANTDVTGKETVGICFRCGSTEHILARCRRPTPRIGPELPFATCFVCGAKGHLASKCPSNAGKGVYPNGGCCKLCSSVEHLAKDCPLRQASATTATNATISSAPDRSSSRRGFGAKGADDDDFHEFARMKHEVDVEEKTEAKRRKLGPASGETPPARDARKIISF